MSRRKSSLIFTFSSSFLVFLTLSSSLSALQQTVEASSSSPYDSGYDHGCDDADISDADDRYINQPEKGPSFHTDEFMDGYNAGFDDCSGGDESDDTGSSEESEDFEEDGSEESEDFEEDGSANTRDNNGGGIYWAGICSKLDFFIIEPCENLVTNNGYDLTDKGKRVAACIAGGGLLTALDPTMQTLLAAQPLGKAVGCSTLLSELGGGGIGGLLGALG